MNYEVVINLNTKLGKELINTSDKMIYTIARTTLDLTAPIIPFNTGKLRSSSYAYGVKPIDNGYEIGSNTYYASDVWNLNADETNWTTPGTTSKWYATEWNRKRNNIVSQSISKWRLK